MRRRYARSAQWRGPQSARRFCLHLPRSSIRREPPNWGEAGKGSGETWNRGRDFPGPGAVPGFPQCDTKLVSLLQPVRSGAGSRKRNAATASALVARMPGHDRNAQCPPERRDVVRRMCGEYVDGVNVRYSVQAVSLSDAVRGDHRRSTSLAMDLRGCHRGYSVVVVRTGLSTGMAGGERF